MTRKSFSLLLTFGGLVFLLFGTGCGPKYPNCTTDEHCAKQGQYCVNKLCRDCADDSHCSASDACKYCGEGFVCQRTQGCCTSDLDCPGGRCYKIPGSNLGQCGDRCRSNEDCPPGQICKGGQCVPDVECRSDADCPSGKKCVDGRCVAATCSLETIYFDFDESTLRSDARSTLNKNGECIKERNQGVLLEGHCDERGTDEYNMALGERRARAAKGYLEKISGGVKFRTISYGEERPVCTEADESCWWRNRRAEQKFE